MKKHHLGYLLAMAAGLAAVAFVVYRWRNSGFAWDEFLDTLRTVDLSWLGVSLVLILATYVGRTLRWEVMLRPLTPPLNKPAPRLGLLSATCIGFTAVVLFGRAGEPVRPYLIARKAGVSFSSQVAAWVVERILDLLMVLVIFGVALTQVSRSAIQPGPRIEIILQTGGALAGVTGVLCLALLLGLRQFHGNVQKRLLAALSFLPDRLVGRVESFFTAFEKGMQSTRSSSFVLLLIFYTIVEWALVAGSFYCLFQAFPATVRLGIIDIVLVLGFVCFGSIVQIPGLGGGIQIVTVLVLTQFYGVGLETASGIALLWWAANFLMIVPIGLVLAFHEGIKFRNLKNISIVTSGGSA